MDDLIVYVLGMLAGATAYAVGFARGYWHGADAERGLLLACVRRGRHSMEEERARLLQLARERGEDWSVLDRAG